MNEKVKFTLKFVIALILILVSGYFTIQGIDLDELKEYLLNLNYWWVVATVPILLFSHYLRALRWKTMLQPIFPDKHFSVYGLFKSVMIGYAANSVTPRGGEVLRPYMYARSQHISFTSTFATIVLERFLDLLTLLVIFLLSIVAYSQVIIDALEKVFEKMNVEISPSNFLFLVVTCAVVLISSFFPPVVEFLLKIFVKPLSKKIYDWVLRNFHKFTRGYAIIREPSQYFKITWQSVGIWLNWGIPMYILFFAFDFQQHLNLSIGDAFLLLIVSGVAMTIAPTPGGIGVQHLAISYAMIILYSQYGINERETIAYAIVVNGSNYIVNTIVGGYYYIRQKKNINYNLDEREKLEHEIENDNELILK